MRRALLVLAAANLVLCTAAGASLLSAESPRKAASAPTLILTVYHPLILTPVPRAATKRPVRPKAPVRDAHTPSSRVSAASGSMAGRLACIRGPESGGDYSARSKSGKYGGAYQFDGPTWREHGGTGDPASASRAEQDRVAENVIRSDGGVKPGRWPTPARRGC